VIFVRNGSILGEVPRIVPTLPVRPFTVSEYHRLVEAGILKSGDPYELINGWIVPKMTINPPHNSAVRRLSRRLGRLLGDEWVLQVQGPITLVESDSEPEPDLAIMFGPEELYDDKNPRGGDVTLVVEVADTSLAEDRGERLQMYSRARIPVYWIVNLVDRVVEIYTLPRSGRTPTYRKHQEYGPGERVPVLVGGNSIGEIAVDQILP
jgi:Uma2 family endonuclease